MRPILIRLTHVVIQVLLFYAAFRMCQRLLRRALMSALWNQGAVSPVSIPSSPGRYCLPERASDSR